MDVVSLLAKAGARVHTSGRQTRRGWCNLRCCWCGRDPYLGYNLRGRYFNCWACGPKPLAATLAKLLRLDARAAAALAAELPSERTRRPEHAGVLRRPPGLVPLGGPHAEYLLERGRLAGEPGRFLPAKLAALWGVRAIAGVLGGRLGWRLYLPVTRDGEEVSWTTRAIGRREPRYWSAPDEDSAVPIAGLVYGLDFVGGSASVHEGPLDAIAVGHGGCAVLRSKPTAAQIAQLSRVPRRVVCFDNEPDAQERAKWLCRQLAVFGGETHRAVLESAKDAAAAHPDELADFRRRFLSDA